jgi:two-component system response regulator (stage 0 sporulation protein F)
MEEQINILVVDDEEVMRSLFTDLFNERGFKVSVAKNGKEAIELVKGIFFHIVFLDVHMPVINGVQALRSIKEMSPKTSIVMMDSFPDIFAEEALKEGAITCIHKPFDIQEVIKIVNETIENKEKV